jgi:polyisoprenoid-binding protein YceI
MKKTILFILTALISGGAFAQYKPSDKGSSLNFSIKNFGVEVTGKFTGLQGDIKFDPTSPELASFDVTIDAESVNTENSLRDHHLQGESYFDVKNYPRIHFISDKVSAAKNGTFTVTGRLTIKKQTKVITFPFTATTTDDGCMFKGQFSINRKDFDVGGTSTISDKLEVSLNVLATKKLTAQNQ